MLASKGRLGTSNGVVAVGRGTLPSITDVETALLTLTPAFLGALRDVAPKKPRSKVGYVIAFAIVGAFGVLAADTSTREFGITKGRAIAARLQESRTTQLAATPVVPVNALVVTTAAQVAVPSADAPAQAVAPPVVPPVAAPVVNVAPAKKGAKTAPTVPSKRPPHSAVRHSTQGRTAMLATKTATM